ncbi:MAG: beta-propeller fold lactonase family protein [Fimbriimonadaceae bacterium]|nr:beta-propeller fold lactonase family protein [Fimbriimonadaceae bacterium]
MSWLACLLLLAPASPGGWPGPQPDGRMLLANGWSLTPHGRQVALPSDLPVRLVAQPGGSLLAVQHCGYREHQVTLVDPAAERIVGQLQVPRSWSGCAWTGDGRRLLVSGGVDDVVHVFDQPALQLGQPAAPQRWPVGDPNALDLVAGLTVGPEGHVYVPLQRTAKLVKLSPTGQILATWSLPRDSFPCEAQVAADGQTVYVSLWNGQRVVGLDTTSGLETARYPTGQHPCQMLLAPDGRLYVSNANDNTVTVIDTRRRRVDETIVSALYPNAPPGSTPNALALTADGETLLIANADNNNLAVVDVEQRGKARGRGFVPTGWYPTAVYVTPGGKVVVANGKGVQTRPNPGGPQPGRRTDTEQYIGRLFLGSLSFYDLPRGGELGQLSARAYRNSPLQPAATPRGLVGRPVDSPLPAQPGGRTPVRYCVYVIKENRTYDQVLGDDPRGNGDPSLCLFPREVTPNHHALAEEFPLLDNFYVESEVSADGHEWTMGAYASDFVERSWPVGYGGKDSVELANGQRAGLGYPSEGAFRVATPRGGYLFDLAARGGVSFRSYGEFVTSGPGQTPKAHLPVLEGHFDPLFRGFDMRYSEQARVDQFLTEFRQFEAAGDLPRLLVVRLPNDHTAGTSAGLPTPRAMVADNDLGLGRLIAALSRSRYWHQMAVFVVEDDAQNGPDHVDAHRSPGFVISPYARRGAVVHTQYSTCSMLRTMELILGLPPLSQFDAAALPLWDCFTATPDFRPYDVRRNLIPLDEMNTRTAWGADLSATFDFTREDAADDLLLNEVVWRSIKGPASPLPSPVRAAFVRVIEEDEEE